MSSGTNKQRLDQNNAKIQQITQALNRKIIGEGNYDTAKGLADGSLTEFVASDFGVTSLMPYRFQNFTSLTKLDLRGVTNIPEYTADGCTGITELILDENTTNVSRGAFSGCNNNSLEADLDFKQNLVTIGESAFYGCRVKTLKGYFGNIGQWAFRQASSSVNDILGTIQIKVYGEIGEYAFSVQRHVSTLNIDKTSNITRLNVCAFQQFGSDRTLPENNILVFDFRNSTFTELLSSVFAGVSSDKNKYLDIYLPASCGTLSSACFRYSDHFNIYYKSVPTLANTNAFSNTTNIKNFFPYNLVYTAKNSTNWSSSTNSIVNSIFGYAEENTFSLGDTLPETDSDGYALTWYSDIGMTTQVTTVSDPTAIYYCSVGSKIKTKLSTTSYQATLTVSDGINTYSNGDLIPIGSTLTITAVGDSGYPDPYIFTLNGTTIASGDTYSVTNDTINIVCIYYDGVNLPVDPVFANNSPAQIKVAVDNGLHRVLWNIGDTKTITMQDSSVYTLKYIDQQANRYEKVSGTGYTNAVFEFNPLIDSVKMLNSDSITSGWAITDINTITMPAIFSNLPSDWQAIISEVKVPSATSYNDDTIVYANDNLFIASGQEVFGTSYLDTYYYDEGCTQFDWYAGKTNADRIKQYNNVNTNWWLRSPSKSSGYFATVYNNGTISQTLASYTNQGVCAIFAI